MELELIDENEMEPKEDGQILKAVRWWERMRILFSILIITTQLLIMTSMSWETTLFGISNAVIGSVFYLVAVNACYCLGWGIDILIRFYFKSKGLDWQWRVALFVLGTLFSILVTAFIYVDTLSLYYYD